MNPETNKFEPLTVLDFLEEKREKNPGDSVFKHLLRPNGEPVPKHWTILTQGEEVILKNYTFKVAYMGESYLVLEPIGPIIIGQKNDG